MFRYGVPFQPEMFTQECKNRSNVCCHYLPVHYAFPKNCGTKNTHKNRSKYNSPAFKQTSQTIIQYTARLTTMTRTKATNKLTSFRIEECTGLHKHFRNWSKHTYRNRRKNPPEQQIRLQFVFHFRVTSTREKGKARETEVRHFCTEINIVC